MKQMVVYDEQGNILYRVPTNGNLKAAEVDIPDGKDLKKLDTSQNPPVEIFSDIEANTLESNHKKIEKIEERIFTVDAAVAEGYEEALKASEGVERLEEKMDSLMRMIEDIKKK